MALFGLTLGRLPLAALAACCLLASCVGTTEQVDEDNEHEGTADPGDGDGDGDDGAGDGDGDDGTGDGDQGPDDPDGDGDGDGDGDTGDGDTGDGDVGDGDSGDGDASVGDGDVGDGDGDTGPDTRPRCKRGVAYGYHSPADLQALSKGVSWWYNWSPRPDEQVRSEFEAIGVDFMPMVWDERFDVNEVIDAIPESSEYLLAFNEPNFGAQADMTPEEAAALWPQLEQIASAKGLALVSPALNFCGDDCNETDPFVYLDKFFAACSDCKIDALAAHWYACTPEALSWYLGELKKYNLPIWLTEFSCGDDADRSLEKQKKYMAEAVAVLEADASVARYAWFAGRTEAIPNVDLLAGDGQLTELGELYLSLPRADCQP